MSKFMKMLNNVSRSQAIYRQSKISSDDIHPGHYAFALAICRNPGSSQEELAKELCINKSTVARNLIYLEENGYVTRTPLPNDRRQFSVHPTEKMNKVIPSIKNASAEWMALLSEGISDDDMSVFNSVLKKMESRAREIVERQEEHK